MRPTGRPAVNIQHCNNLTRSLVTQTNGESYPRILNSIKQKGTAINLPLNSTTLLYLLPGVRVLGTESEAVTRN